VEIFKNFVVDALAAGAFVEQGISERFVILCRFVEQIFVKIVFACCFSLAVSAINIR
jgi:formate/nitrite transporter FocA (FNT family)